MIPPDVSAALQDLQRAVDVLERLRTRQTGMSADGAVMQLSRLAVDLDKAVRSFAALQPLLDAIDDHMQGFRGEDYLLDQIDRWWWGYRHPGLPYPEDAVRDKEIEDILTSKGQVLARPVGPPLPSTTPRKRMGRPPRRGALPVKPVLGSER